MEIFKSSDPSHSAWVTGGLDTPLGAFRHAAASSLHHESGE
jgi:hypothetical protein